MSGTDDMALTIKKQRGDEPILFFTKTIYDFKNKSQADVKEILKLELETLLRENPRYKIKNAVNKNVASGAVEYTITLERKLS